MSSFPKIKCNNLGFTSPINGSLCQAFTKWGVFSLGGSPLIFGDNRDGTKISRRP